MLRVQLVARVRSALHTTFCAIKLCNDVRAEAGVTTAASSDSDLEVLVFEDCLIPTNPEELLQYIRS